jgi:hypothetical protein
LFDLKKKNIKCTELLLLKNNNTRAKSSIEECVLCGAGRDGPRVQQEQTDGDLYTKVLKAQLEQ